MVNYIHNKEQEGNGYAIAYLFAMCLHFSAFGTPDTCCREDTDRHVVLITTRSGIRMGCVF